jgi:hypothetical protein
MLTWFTMGLGGCVLLQSRANLEISSLPATRSAPANTPSAPHGSVAFPTDPSPLTESLVLAFAGGALGLVVAL